MNNNNEVNDVLGIDISKAKFDVALIQGNAKIKSKVFANNPEGFAELQAWLNTQGVTNLHGCMEATSTYGNALARFLVEAGYKVSIVNPSRPKAFGKSELSRTKTDRADAKVIARFCAALKPALWTPPPLEIEQLQALVHRLDSLTSMPQLWRLYLRRFAIDHWNRFAKQRLHWTLTHLLTPQQALRWSDLRQLLSWQLWLARQLVIDSPLHWQKTQTNLSFGRVAQGFATLLVRIGSPACPPKPRGKSLGWKSGRKRAPFPRFPIIKKRASRPKQGQQRQP
jgi:hypothetical protein